MEIGPVHCEVRNEVIHTYIYIYVCVCVCVPVDGFTHLP